MSDFYEEAKVCGNMAILRLGKAGKVSEENREKIFRYVQREMDKIFKRGRAEAFNECATMRVSLRHYVARSDCNKAYQSGIADFRKAVRVKMKAKP